MKCYPLKLAWHSAGEKVKLQTFVRLFACKVFIVSIYYFYNLFFIMCLCLYYCCFNRYILPFGCVNVYSLRLYITHLLHKRCNHWFWWFHVACFTFCNFLGKQLNDAVGKWSTWNLIDITTIHSSNTGTDLLEVRTAKITL